MSALHRLRAALRPGPAPGPDRAAGGPERHRRLPDLRAAGWVLPPSLARDDVVPSWTRLGVIDGAGTVPVDSRGLVTPRVGADGWSLDWWIGAEDRWYLPAREPGTSQRRIDGAPVVETTLRIPGGTVVHRAYAARGPAYAGGDQWVVVEVENRSPVPVALAWAVRPYTPVGLNAVAAVELVPADPRVPTGTQHLTVGGDVEALLPRAPSRWARAADGTDPVHQVTAGEAHTGPFPEPGAVAPGQGDPGSGGDHGLVSAAFLTPLAHTATARLALPVDRDPVAAPAALTGWPTSLPTAEAVARGWTALADRGPRVELPDPVMAEAVAAARRSLPLAHRVLREPAASDTAPPPATHTVTTGTGAGDPAAHRLEMVAALAWWGEADAVDRVLATWPDDQQRGGGFGSPEATAIALRALAVHAVASGDAGPARAWLPEVGGAIESLGRAARKVSPGTDSRVVAEGLDAGALLLARLGQPEAAARVAADAARAAGASPVDPDLDAPSTTPRALASAAVAAARAGAPSGALWALLRRASATWTWSDPDRWVGDDGLVPARLLDAVARLLVADRPEGPALIPWLPPTWWGRGWEVHGAPTRWGTLSYAVRWHGDRPAVLWELSDPPGDDDPAPTAAGVGPDAVGPTLTAPGLDPGWSSPDRRGEALLGAVPPPPEAGIDSAPDGASPADGPARTAGAVAIAAPPRSVWRPQDVGPDAPPPAPAGSDSSPSTGSDPDPGATPASSTPASGAPTPTDPDRGTSADEGTSFT